MMTTLKPYVNSNVYRMMRTRAWILILVIQVIVVVISVVTLESANLNSMYPVRYDVASIVGSAAPFVFLGSAYDMAACIRSGIDPASSHGAHRRHLIAGRLLAVECLAILLVFINVLVVFCLASLTVDGYTISTTLDSSSVVSISGSLIVTSIMAVMGISIGVIVRHPAAAVAVTLGWFAIVESVLAILLGTHERWLPGRASDILLDSYPGSHSISGSATYALVAWTIVIATFGYHRFIHSDLK